MPRHNIFIGTVNEDTFLSDATGNRRFWPVAVQKVDIEFVLRNRDAIWAAAVALESAGYCHWFEDESLVEPAHEAFIVQDPWHDIILTYVQGQKRVTNEEVFKFAICAGVLNVDMSKYTKGAQMQIADTLKRLGCKRGNDRPISWTVPPNLASKPKQSEETSLEKLKNRYS
jgi:putative DNA primase/helicase